MSLALLDPGIKRCRLQLACRLYVITQPETVKQLQTHIHSQKDIYIQTSIFPITGTGIKSFGDSFDSNKQTIIIMPWPEDAAELGYNAHSPGSGFGETGSAHLPHSLLSPPCPSLLPGNPKYLCQWCKYQHYTVALSTQSKQHGQTLTSSIESSWSIQRTPEGKGRHDRGLIYSIIIQCNIKKKMFEIERLQLMFTILVSAVLQEEF